MRFFITPVTRLCARTGKTTRIGCHLLLAAEQWFQHVDAGCPPRRWATSVPLHRQTANRLGLWSSHDHAVEKTHMLNRQTSGKSLLCVPLKDGTCVPLRDGTCVLHSKMPLGTRPAQCGRIAQIPVCSSVQSRSCSAEDNSFSCRGSCAKLCMAEHERPKARRIAVITCGQPPPELFETHGTYGVGPPSVCFAFPA